MDKKIKLFFLANSIYDNLERIDGVSNTSQKIYNYFIDFVCEENDSMFVENENRENVTKQLTDFLKKVNQEDIFVFYFCGHGFIIPPEFSKFLMATSETSEDTLIMENGLPFHVLVSIIQQYSLNKCIIIIDSCYSGAALKNMGDGNIINETVPEGIVLITSTTSKKQSYTTKIENEEHSVFSYYFWKALCDNNYKNELRSIKDIFSETRVQLENNALFCSMKPQIKCENDLINYCFLPKPNFLKRMPFSLEVIDWRITSLCDNNCPFCYASKLYKDLSESNINKVISEINKTGCNTICITGGEPTLSDKIIYIIEELYNRKFSIYLSTNGAKYLEKREEFENYLDKLSLPLDGYDAESNKINGRNQDSFDTVKRILDFYYNNRTNKKMAIKVSTLLTKKNCNIQHFEKMYNFLKNYPIDIWKIYEFIPESRGASQKNRINFELTNNGKKRIKDIINELSLKSNFRIEFVERKDRNSAYFVITPNGDVMIPMESDSNEIVEEVKMGNLVNDGINKILSSWYKNVDYDNYLNNLRVRDFKRSIVLTEKQKKVLQEVVSFVDLPSLAFVSDKLQEEYSEVEKAFNDLFNLRIIKKTIPIINLEHFNLNTYLVTLKIKNNGKLAKRHIAEILCYNNNLGWVLEFENGSFRIAIFAHDIGKVEEIIKNEIACYLQHDLVDYDTQTLLVAYAFGETNLLNHSKRKTYYFEKYIKKEKSKNLSLSIDEYNLLEKFNILNQVTIENIDELYYESDSEALPIINNLLKNKVIEKMHSVLDTKLIGYDWYLIFVKQISNKRELDKIEFSQYLYDNFNSLTHINCFEDRGRLIDCIMDFEIHVKTGNDIERIIRKIENKYNNIRHCLKNKSCTKNRNTVEYKHE